MNWIKRFFGPAAAAQSAPTSSPSAILHTPAAPSDAPVPRRAEPTEPPPAPGRGSPAGDGWYRATSRDGAIRQVVLEFPAAAATATEFGTLMLPHDKFPVLATTSWCAGLCRINGQYVAMVRAAEFAARARTAGLKLAFSFCHMSSGAVLLLSARIEAPEITAAVRRKFGHVPPLDCPVAEWISGLSSYDRELIPAMLATTPFRLVLAEDSPSRSSVYLPNGTVQESALPDAVCEFRIDLAEAGRGALQEEWRALLRHDESIPAYRRDFQAAANRELVAAMPIEQDPILPRPT